MHYSRYLKRVAAFFGHLTFLGDCFYVINMISMRSIESIHCFPPLHLVVLRQRI